MMFQYDPPVEYVTEEAELVLSSNAVIIDDYTSVMETGEFEERQLGSLRKFFENLLAGRERNGLMSP